MARSMSVTVILQQLAKNRTGSGWAIKVLQTFTGGDGGTPLATLIFDQLGNLYGDGCGIVHNSCLMRTEAGRRRFA